MTMNLMENQDCRCLMHQLNRNSNCSFHYGPLIKRIKTKTENHAFNIMNLLIQVATSNIVDEMQYGHTLQQINKWIPHPKTSL